MKKARALEWEPRDPSLVTEPIPAELFKRLRARIARRPGLWRHRMQSRSRRKRQREEDAKAA